MGRDKGIAEGIENIGAILFLYKVRGSNVRELVVWEGDVQGRYEEVEGLAGALLVDGPERCHLGFTVESKP